MSAKVVLLNNGTRIEGICSYGAWTDNCVIALERINGKWVIDKSIPIPNDLEIAKMVLEAFNMAFQSIGIIGDKYIDSFDAFSLFSPEKNNELMKFFMALKIYKPSELVSKMCIPDFNLHCRCLSDSEKEKFIKWMDDVGFTMIPF